MSNSASFFRNASVTAMGALVLTVAGMGLSATGAHAEQNEMNEGIKGCNVKLAGGTQTSYPAGTRLTVDIGDGQKETYRCDGNTGEWVREAAIVSGASSRSPLQNRIVALQPGARLVSRFQTTAIQQNVFTLQPAPMLQADVSAGATLSR